MLTTINTMVQALVWTSMAGLFFLVWLNRNVGTGRMDFSLSSYSQRIIYLLQHMWMILAIALIVTLLLFAYPATRQINAAPASGCTTSMTSSSCPGSSSTGP